jgi:hypothetical protein
MERTLPLAEAAGGFSLSPRFDSTRALSRLTNLSDSDRAILSPGAPIPRLMDKLRRDHDAARVLAIIGTATLVALLMTFV